VPLTRSKEISTPDRPSTAEALAARTPSRKVVVDVERNHCEISDLTVDDAHVMAADMTARQALRRRWEASGDPQALLDALIFFQLQLPEWFFKGLMQNFEQQFKNPDATRFLAMVAK